MDVTGFLELWERIEILQGEKGGCNRVFRTVGEVIIQGENAMGQILKKHRRE